MEKPVDVNVTEGVCPEGLELIWEKPVTLTDNRMHYCPGCGHGVMHKVLMEVIDEMALYEYYRARRAVTSTRSNLRPHELLLKLRLLPFMISKI